MSIFAQRNSPNKYIKNFDFAYNYTRSQFTVTSVTGHLLDYEFSTAFTPWSSCDPFELFDAPVVTSVKKGSETIARNLESEARRADTLMIWTDCDREGENIGAEIARLCRRGNANIQVRRARFSAIIAQYVNASLNFIFIPQPLRGRQIHNAAQHPVQLDMAQSNAVEARIHLDLRVGSAFTRLQTLNLQRRYEALKKEIVSYGTWVRPHYRVR